MNDLSQIGISVMAPMAFTEVVPETVSSLRRRHSFGSSQWLRLPLQGYLTDKNTLPPRTLPWAYALGPRGVLGGLAFSYGRGTPVNLNTEP